MHNIFDWKSVFRFFRFEPNTFSLRVLFAMIYIQHESLPRRLLGSFILFIFLFCSKVSSFFLFSSSEFSFSSQWIRSPLSYYKHDRSYTFSLRFVSFPFPFWFYVEFFYWFHKNRIVYKKTVSIITNRWRNCWVSCSFRLSILLKSFFSYRTNFNLTSNIAFSFIEGRRT